METMESVALLAAEELALRPEVLEGQLRELENSIAHLRRSNQELSTALAEAGGEDRDFREAINENIVILLQKEQRAIELRDQVGKVHIRMGACEKPL